MNTEKEIKPTFMLGGTREINRFGYGAMQLTGKGIWGETPRRDLAKQVLKEAFNAGVNFFDTADAYGPGTNEILIHDALSGHYNEITIATKGGLVRNGPGQWTQNGNPDHIRKAIEGSLKRLKLEQIYLWQLHRLDSLYPVEDTLKPVAEAVKAGKIKHVGLSEVSVKEIEQAQKILPIVSVQNMYNLGNRRWEEVLDYTTEHNMAFIPWFPLSSGPDKLKDKVGDIASKYNATPAQIALAWLYRRANNILLIPGTHSLEHLHENLKARDIELSDEDFGTLSR